MEREKITACYSRDLIRPAAEKRSSFRHTAGFRPTAIAA